MDKKFKDYNFLFKKAAKTHGYIIVDKKDLKEAVTISTPAFETYPLFRYFTPEFNHRDWMDYRWRVFKAIYKDAVIFTAPTRKCAVVIFCNDYVKTKPSSYFFNGVWKSNRRLGKDVVKRINDFEEFALQTRKKHTNCKGIYCFDIGVKKEAQGMGIGHSINRFIQDFCDEHKLDAYFETHTIQNVEIYKKMGFTLVETLPVPNSNVTQYCFMYKHKTKHK